MNGLTTRGRIAALGLAQVVLLAAAALSQEKKAATEGAAPKKVLKVENAEQAAMRERIKASLQRFQLATVGPPAVVLQPETVVQWDNNARASKVGATVVFRGPERPEAVVCVFPFKGELWHEFSSLSRGLITGELEGQVFWQPQQPGLVFQALANAPPPQATASARLLQLKRMARRFQVKLLGWRDNDPQQQQLRLQPRPIYRYQNPSGDTIDGAVFSFVSGVDPEAILLIEAVKTNGPRWEYAFARRTSGGLEGRLDAKVVWSTRRFPQMGNPAAINRGVVEELNVEEVKTEGP